MRFFYICVLCLVSCTKNPEALAPETPPPVRSLEETSLWLGGEELRVQESSSLNTHRVVLTRVSTGEVAEVRWSYRNGAWELDGIESVPCWCVPECSSYNASLCRWWKCVEASINQNGGDIIILLAGTAHPALGVGFATGIMIGCMDSPK